MNAAQPWMKILWPDRQCRTYLLADPRTRHAVLIDPKFELVPQTLDELKRENLELKWAIDTHTHADHLSGSARLRSHTGCRIAMSGQTGARTPDHRADDDELLGLGSLEMRFLHTPGHTPDSMCVQVGNQLFTGDTLFIGGSARTDFMGGSASALFDSFRRLEALGETVEVLPGHDYNKRLRSTIGEELRSNPAFRERDRARLVARLDVPGELPANMREMLLFNVHGGKGDIPIIEARALETLGRPGRDFTLLDVRTSAEFAAGRAPGAVSIPLPELESRLAEVNALKQPLVVTCKSGVRATLAIMVLRLNGSYDARLLEGSMDGWARQGLPMQANEGSPRVIAPSAGPAAACAAGGTCASATPAGGVLELIAASPTHSWWDWSI